jgi:hypothetical protein
LDDAQVIAQVRSGTTDAFGEIVDHYQAPIVRYLARLTGEHEVAGDCTSSKQVGQNRDLETEQSGCLST